MRKWLLAIALVCSDVMASTAATTPAQPLEAGALEAWLDGIIPFALNRGDVAGAVIVVVKDDHVLLQKGYGYADVAAQRPVDPDTTLFRVGSISKLFTWTAVMQQVELGKIDLDADINRYLDFKIPPFDGQPVTMRNLMTHTARFEESGKKMVAYDPRDALTLDRYMHQIMPKRIFTPGEVSAYSNYGTALAGYIVQRVSGQPFEDYVDAHILAPLGMRWASFRQPLPAELKSHMANGYPQASGEPQPFEYIAVSPAGAGSMSGGDIAKFMIAHLQDGAYGTARILNATTAQTMHSSPFTVISPDLHRMTLGFFEMDRNGRRVIGHGGDTAWFHSGLWLWPDDKVGIFVAVNSLGKDSTVSVLRTLLFEQFADRYLPGPGPQGSVDPQTSRQHAAMMGGQYIGSRRVETSFLSLQNLFSQDSVQVDGDGLLSIPALAYVNGQERKYREIAPFVWREINGKNRLAAKAVDGKVVAFSEDNISFALTPMRPSPWKDASWLLPAFVLALGILTVTTIAWASGAALRRRYNVPLSLTGKVASGYRATRLWSLFALLLMLGWIYLMFNVPSRTHLAALLVDPSVIALTALSYILFPGSLIVAGVHAVRAWNTRTGWRGMIGRGWDVLVIAACFILLWVAIAFHLIGFSLRY